MEKSAAKVVLDIPVLVNHKALIQGDALCIYKPVQKEKAAQEKAIDTKRSWGVESIRTAL